MSTTGHEHELVEVQGLKASMKKGGNIGIYNDVVCSTAGATAAKVTNTVPPSFSLTNKAKILVKFTYGINVANATLQVGENAAKPIFYQGSALDAGRVKAGMFVLMQYDGTNFNILGDIAKMDEYYKDLHAGLADNLFGETQTNDVFTFRPTAGIQDVESGDAPVGGGTIKKVEGNAVAWNQILNPSTIEETVTRGGVTYTNNGDGSITISGKKDDDSYMYLMHFEAAEFFRNVIGHKLYIPSFRSETSEKITVSSWFNSSGVLYDMFVVPSNFSNANMSVSTLTNEQFSGVTIKPVIFDLTLLFGSGNEPSTVAEFEAWLANNVGLKDYYPYNEGELIPVKDFKVKSVGFNAWDEEWEIGARDGNTGVLVPAYTNFITSKNLIPVIPNTQYFFNQESIESAYIYQYDANGNYLGENTRLYLNRPVIFTTDANCRFIHFASEQNGYVNSICISLSYDGDRDGEYEEHWEREVGVDVTKVYGKLNGVGESVQVFPNGLKSAGTVRDEIVRRGDKTIGIKRVGSIDLGSSDLGWTPDAGSGRVGVFVTSIPRMKPVEYDETANISCAKYVTKPVYIVDESGNNYTIGSKRYEDSNQTFIQDAALDGFTKPQVSEALSGVILYYEFETPEEYILDEDVLPVQYRVDNYGTEEVILGNDEGLVSSSPKMTISYGINAADTIADLPHHYVSVLPQQLDEDKQKQARRNINAASQDSIIRIQEQLDAINPKVDNDVYVDMGLPSGLLWAKRNIDVTQPDGFAASEYTYDASYFSWGNVDGHNPDGNTFDYDFGPSNDGPYASTPGAKLTGNISLSYDAARAALGAPWRISSREEFQELLDYSDFIDANGDVISSTTPNKIITMNGVYGVRLKSKINGKIIFFPCTGLATEQSLIMKETHGYYRSCSLDTMTNSFDFSFSASGVSTLGSSSRYIGMPIRPVM